MKLEIRYPLYIPVEISEYSQVTLGSFQAIADIVVLSCKFVVFLMNDDHYSGISCLVFKH